MEDLLQNLTLESSQCMFVHMLPVIVWKSCHPERLPDLVAGLREASCTFLLNYSGKIMFIQLSLEASFTLSSPMKTSFVYIKESFHFYKNGE